MLTESNDTHDYKADRLRLERMLDERTAHITNSTVLVTQDGRDFYFSLDVGMEVPAALSMSAPTPVEDWDMRGAQIARAWFIAEFMQRYPGVTPRFAAEAQVIELVMSSAFVAHDDDGEESRFDRILLDVGVSTDEEVESYIDSHYPREHCQHAHDCCGNWYMQHASFDRSGKFAVVTLSYVLNI